MSILCCAAMVAALAMDSVGLWFERKFEFTFPVELHPNLYARLRGTPVRLEDLVRGVTRETMVRRPGEKWSAQEHAGHLWDLESLWLARVEDYLGSGAELRTADLSNRATSEANHNDRPIETILNEFRSARQRLMNRAADLDSAIFSRTRLHPRLKQPMRLVDHLFFVAEHDDHHLARIWELIRSGQDGKVGKV